MSKKTIQLIFLAICITSCQKEKEFKGELEPATPVIEEAAVGQITFSNKTTKIEISGQIIELNGTYFLLTTNPIKKENKEETYPTEFTFRSKENIIENGTTKTDKKLKNSPIYINPVENLNKIGKIRIAMTQAITKQKIWVIQRQGEIVNFIPARVNHYNKTTIKYDFETEADTTKCEGCALINQTGEIIGIHTFSKRDSNVHQGEGLTKESILNSIFSANISNSY